MRGLCGVLGRFLAVYGAVFALRVRVNDQGIACAVVAARKLGHPLGRDHKAGAGVFVPRLVDAVVILKVSEPRQDKVTHAPGVLVTLATYSAFGLYSTGMNRALAFVQVTLGSFSAYWST